MTYVKVTNFWCRVEGLGTSGARKSKLELRLELENLDPVR